MNKVKLETELRDIIFKYENLPIDSGAVQRSFINEIAEYLVSMSWDEDEFFSIMKFFRKFNLDL